MLAKDVTGQTVRAPSNASVTIFCREFRGAQHYQTAKAAEKRAAEVMRSNDFYVVRGEDRSVLYHGFYRTADSTIDEKSAREVREDREQIERITLNGVQFFPRAIVASLDRADPKAPAEWDLRNSDAFWTVVIGVYTDPARRKRAAVDSVRQARDMGVEAYFLHDEGHSYICLGSWPADAVKRQMDLNDRDAAGRVARDEYNPAPIIVSNGAVPDAVLRDIRQNLNSNAPLLTTRVEYNDPTLEKIASSYPYSVDGEPRNDTPLLLNVNELLGRETQEAVDPAEKRAVDEKLIDTLLKRPGA
ncbi:MAG: hypothetical protein AAGK78_01795 [Planctomycetota bacterium]